MINDIFTNVSILAAFLLVVGQVFKNNSFDSRQGLKFQALLGLIFGVLGIILMLFTIRMPYNVIFDLRNIAIICSSIMGGPVAALLTAGIIAMFRIILFGINTASITGFVTILLIGAGAAYICSAKLSRLKRYVLVFILSMLLSTAALIYIIGDNVKLIETLAYFWPTYIFGAVLAYFTSGYIISASSNYRMMSYYRMTADNLLDMISTHDPGGRIIFVSPSVKQLLGYTPEEFIGTTSLEYIHPEDIAMVVEAASASQNTGDNYTQIFRMRHKNGKYIWAETSAKSIFNDEGSLKETICVTRDITDRKRIEQELRVSSARIKAILDNAGTGIVLRDGDGNLIDANQAYLEMVGYEIEEVKHLSSLVPEEDYTKVQKVLDDLMSGKCSSDKSDIRYLNKNGQTKYAEVTSTFIPGTEYTPASIIRVVNDITERIRKEEELIKAKSDADKLAATDFLTGLLNRRAFSKRINMEFQGAARDKKPICLILADIDHFKETNDIYGHQIGDFVLQRIAKCLSDTCRPYDFIGRQGGEEFIICLPNTTEEQGKSAAERMRAAVQELDVNTSQRKELIRITASFGVASFIPKEGDSTDKLIIQADDALYKAKEEGRNKVCTYGAKVLKKL